MEWITIVLIVCGFICVLLGMAGSVLPVLPGPPISMAGLVMLHFAGPTFSLGWFGWTLAILLTVIGIVVDYVIPSATVKMFGGTKMGATGAGIGQIIGLYWGLWGSIIGSFVGTFAGESARNQGWKQSLKSSVGSTIGFVVSALIKLFITFVHLVIFIVVFFIGL